MIFDAHKATRFAFRIGAAFAPLTLAFLASAARADNAQFLFDALHGKGAYRVSWERLMKQVQPTPDWLTQFNKNFDGVAGQITDVTIDGKPYSVSFVCKPSDCAEHRFVVLFDDKGAHAYGALGGKNNAPFFYGKPSPSEQDAMAQAMKK